MQGYRPEDNSETIPASIRFADQPRLLVLSLDTNFYDFLVVRQYNRVNVWRVISKYVCLVVLSYGLLYRPFCKLSSHSVGAVEVDRC